MILGLVGGVGSGKSTVTDILKEYGFTLLLTDDIAKELELPGQCCYEAIVSEFGEEILQNGTGTAIDNAKLAAVIYADPSATERINAIVHPAVWNHVDHVISDAKANAAEAAADTVSGEQAAAGTSAGRQADGSKDPGVRIAVETALPGERFAKLCDEIWFIYTDTEERIRRLMSNRGYSREKSLSVIARQLSDKEFEDFADRTIDNSGDREKTAEQVRKLLNEIC